MATRNIGLTKARVAARRKAAKKAKPSWKHQKKTLKIAKASPLVMDGSDPGTGKTRAHLESFAERRAAGSGCALVLAPKTLLETSWDADAFEFTPDMITSVAYASNRQKAFDFDADIYITNLDAIKWVAKQPAKFFKRFDTLIIDEATAYKNRTSQRSKATAKVARHFTHKAILSGTFMAKSVLDVWHPIFILDGGQRLGKSFFQFRASVCHPQQVGPRPEHIQWVDKPGAEEAVTFLLKDIAIRHDFDDCMDIPPNYSYTRRIILPPKLQKSYEEFADHAILELTNDRVSAVNAANVQDKLLQIASGAVYSEGGYQVLDTYRYEYIVDLIKQRKHSVTFFNWRHQRQLLTEIAENEGLDYAVIDGNTPNRERKGIVERYQAGEYQTIFLHPQTGAHGLTLTKGTRTIWSSPVYMPDFVKQGKHRIYRGGQTKRTETIFVCAKGTVEEAVYEKLNNRHAKMVNFLDLLKESQSNE